MTTEREEIIQLARECGLIGYYLKQDDFIFFLHPAPIPEVEAENARLRAALEQYKLLVAAFFHQYDCCIPHQGMMAEAIDELRMYDPEALKGQP